MLYLITWSGRYIVFKISFLTVRDRLRHVSFLFSLWTVFLFVPVWIVTAAEVFSAKFTAHSLWTDSMEMPRYRAVMHFYEQMNIMSSYEQVLICSSLKIVTDTDFYYTYNNIHYSSLGQENLNERMKMCLWTAMSKCSSPKIVTDTDFHYTCNNIHYSSLGLKDLSEHISMNSWTVMSIWSSAHRTKV